MKELIGVCSLDKIIVEDLKRNFLIFDKLYIIGAKDWLFDIHNKEEDRVARPFIEQCIYMFWKDLTKIELGEYQKYLTNELHWLVEQGKIILDNRKITPKLTNYEFNKHFEIRKRLSDYAFKYVNRSKSDSKKYDYIEFVSLVHELSLRSSANWMALNNEVEVYPIIDKYTPIKELETKKQNVFRSVLKKLPMPDDSSPWEAIFEFKNDESSYGSLIGLKNWINEISISNLSMNEIEDKLEYLLYKYEKALKLHEIKSNSSILEILIVGGAETIENVAKLKLGKIAKGFFKIGKDKIELMETELKSEGSELSYITKTNKKFKKTD
jgi:hypothetical protein